MHEVHRAWPPLEGHVVLAQADSRKEGPGQRLPPYWYLQHEWCCMLEVDSAACLGSLQEYCLAALCSIRADVVEGSGRVA